MRAVHRDAGGLVLATDQEHARRIADRLAGIAGETPKLVMSDEPAASARLADFGASKRRWLVSVLMVSEEERRHALELLGPDADEPELEPARRGQGPGFEAQLNRRAARRGHPDPDDEAAVATEDAPPPAARPARPSAPSESAHAVRERLRSERGRLVTLLAGRTREQHRVIHARINRATGARSVGAATREELERGNELLRGELRR